MTNYRRYDAPTIDFRRGFPIPVDGPAGTSGHTPAGARASRPSAGSTRHPSSAPVALDGIQAGWLGGSGERSREGATRTESTAGRPGPAAPRLEAKQSTRPAGEVPRGTVYRSGSRQVRRGLEQRQRRQTAAWVTAGLVLVAAMPTAAIARPFWGPIASLVLFGLALAGVGCLLLAVPARPLPPADEDGGAW